MTIDFYRARLDQMIDLGHPLAVLGRQIAWGQNYHFLGILRALRASAFWLPLYLLIKRLAWVEAFSSSCFTFF